jgi:hypothetical protein
MAKEHHCLVQGARHSVWCMTGCWLVCCLLQVHTSFPHLPVLGLVDWNPAGAAILATYKLGNRRMGLEAVEYAVPQLAWLGVLADMLQVGEQHSNTQPVTCLAPLAANLSCMHGLWSVGPEARQGHCLLLSRHVNTSPVCARGCSIGCRGA